MTIFFILQAALKCKSSTLIVIHNQNRFCFLYLAIICYQSFSFFGISIMIVLIDLDSSCHYSIIFCRWNKITRVYYSFTITIIVSMALEAHQISNTMQWDISHPLEILVIIIYQRTRDSAGGSSFRKVSLRLSASLYNCSASLPKACIPYCSPSSQVTSTIQYSIPFS